MMQRMTTNKVDDNNDKFLPSLLLLRLDIDKQTEAELETQDHALRQLAQAIYSDLLHQLRQRQVPLDSSLVVIPSIRQDMDYLDHR